jgi:hypothetical protein
MSAEADPGGELQHIGGSGQRIQGGILAIELEMVVLREGQVAETLGIPLDERGVLEALRLAECALMEEVVSHPDVGHRRLR